MIRFNLQIICYLETTLVVLMNSEIEAWPRASKCVYERVKRQQWSKTCVTKLLWPIRTVSDLINIIYFSLSVCIVLCTHNSSILFKIGSIFGQKVSQTFIFFDVISDEHFIKRDISNRPFRIVWHFKFRDEKSSETNAKNDDKNKWFREREKKHKNGAIQKYNTHIKFIGS